VCCWYLLKKYKGWKTSDDLLYQLWDEYHTVVVAGHNMRTGIAIVWLWNKESKVQKVEPVIEYWFPVVFCVGFCCLNIASVSFVVDAKKYVNVSGICQRMCFAIPWKQEENCVSLAATAGFHLQETTKIFHEVESLLRICCSLSWSVNFQPFVGSESLLSSW